MLHHRRLLASVGALGGFYITSVCEFAYGMLPHILSLICTRDGPSQVSTYSKRSSSILTANIVQSNATPCPLDQLNRMAHHQPIHASGLCLVSIPPIGRAECQYQQFDNDSSWTSSDRQSTKGQSLQIQQQHGTTKQLTSNYIPISIR
jgi:hypothetical protein